MIVKMPKNLTILTIEDEPDIRELISFNLKKNGFSTISAENGELATSVAREHLPDLILLDLMLPGIHGLDVCRILKSDPTTKNIPIIMLTALGQEENIIEGLDTGADDYITKPFSLQVLNARIKSVLRRYETKNNYENGKTIITNGIHIIPRKRTVSVNHIKLTLTYTEFQILYLLASHPGWVFTRYQIINKIRGENHPVTDRSVDFQIVGLRKKMGDKGKIIETIRGVGYRFQHNET